MYDLSDLETHLGVGECGGVPFLLVDAMLAAKRTRPLTIAGPKGTQARMQTICEALFPGMHVMTPIWGETRHSDAHEPEHAGACP